ncbi:MAG TPA: hypothetical protein VIW78_11500, partial [Burkholderiales bacterium]
MRILDKVERDAPHIADVWLVRADIARVDGNLRDQIKYLTAFLKARPTDSRILRELVALHRSVGNAAEARKYERQLGQVQRVLPR